MKPSGLTPKQEKALAALLSEVTIEAAAKEAGISDVTIWRWMREPTFLEAYQAARRQIVTGYISLLLRAGKQAVAALVKNLTCGVPSTEVAAARIIIELGCKGVEMMELEERLAQLEKEWSGFQEMINDVSHRETEGA